ncbi:hypothetical protein [Thiovibrio frasassiensis]|uniref:Uncharacterized protein n=1 Tax=Thiovibrio frasassiensis TaxID=2984131 RepID=A0A9X4RR52_9BACT|nr:hypothetical protein [Thiovibrio frasassiensis]MDG4476977.1 hypothetical protein [Thiovibrio frasassiensis]
MNKKKLEALKSLGDMKISASEIADARIDFAKSKSSCDKCKKICKWIIEKAAATGSCAAGAAALDGIFALADIVFVEADEILVPLEVVINVAWGTVCGEIGVKVLGKEADKYAKIWCQQAKIC